jgi:hypothetical protein
MLRLALAMQMLPRRKGRCFLLVLQAQFGLHWAWGAQRGVV